MVNGDKPQIKNTMKYIVHCTQIYNGTITVDAESEQEAMQKAGEMTDEVNFSYGETTVDYAEKDEFDQ